jgi:FMN phosphatase YigB (HAD superfamily)
MSLKVITIDFWNTLFDSSGGKHRNALRYHTIMEEISHLGTSVTDEDLDLALKASWEFFNNIWINQQRTPKPVETIEFFLELSETAIFQNFNRKSHTGFLRFNFKLSTKDDDKRWRGIAYLSFEI